MSYQKNILKPDYVLEGEATRIMKRFVDYALVEVGFVRLYGLDDEFVELFANLT